MRFYLISDNIDTQIGMRLAGIEGVVVHEPEEVKNALLAACGLNDVGIVLMTEKLVNLVPDLVYDIKLNRKSPLVVEIPDRHGTAQISETINRYVHEAVGISL
ncbi:MAG: ATP synthase subunit F [Oscillospiraceae bacterium]|nr:ATP synthase subunit F [Oscillospiraceae bacterium]